VCLAALEVREEALWIEALPRSELVMGNQLCCDAEGFSSWPAAGSDEDDDDRLSPLATPTPPPVDGTLTVTVVACTDLVAEDKRGGQPDTYVTLAVGAATRRSTAVVGKTTSPTFDESFDFRLAAGASDAACTLQLSVWSKALRTVSLSLSSKSALIGEAEISLRRAFAGRWEERIDGEWELTDACARVSPRLRRAQQRPGAGLGRIELQLSFRPDVPAGLGLTLLPPGRRPKRQAHRPALPLRSRHLMRPPASPQLHLPPESGWLRVHVRRCTGLLPPRLGPRPLAAARRNAVVSLSVGGGEVVSTQAQSGVDPVFDESFDFWLDQGVPAGSCVLLLQVLEPGSKGAFLGELELQPCAELAAGRWRSRLKREWGLTDRLGRADAKQKRKRSTEAHPCGSIALSIEFVPDELEAEESEWRGATPAAWRSGFARPRPSGGRERTRVSYTARSDNSAGLLADLSAIDP